MTDDVRIETDRLIFTPPTSDDAAEIFERYAGNADVTRYVGWPRHETLDDTRAFLDFSAEQWARWPAGPYLIRAREDGRLLGSTGLSFQTREEAMTGYVLAPDAWGRGLATEALGTMVFLAGQLGVQMLFALVHPEHAASRHVLEKCGFEPDEDWVVQMEFPNIGRGTMQDALRYLCLP